MAEVKQYDFYYGAILNIILSKNPDASPTLLEATEKRGMYKITTNTSKDSIVFCKYASEKGNKNKDYRSWGFSFSDEDKKALKKYYDKKMPVLLYFLCKDKEDKRGRIAICTYEEFCAVQDKKFITIGKRKNTAYFNMHVEKRRDTGIHLKTNRIELRVEDIIDQVVDFSPEHYEKYCKKDEQIGIHINSKAEEKQEKNNNYKTIISGQAVRTLSINHGEEEICPIHNSIMKVAYVHVDRQPDTVHYCERCGKFMVSPKHCKDLKKMLKKRKRFVEFERMEK